MLQDFILKFLKVVQTLFRPFELFKILIRERPPLEILITIINLVILLVLPIVILFFRDLLVSEAFFPSFAQRLASFAVVMIVILLALYTCCAMVMKAYSERKNQG